jgi:hypothetical protein
VQSRLFSARTEEDELRIEEKWLAKDSTINCGPIIILFPTSIWVTD